MTRCPCGDPEDNHYTTYGCLRCERYARSHDYDSPEAAAGPRDSRALTCCSWPVSAHYDGSLSSPHPPVFAAMTEPRTVHGRYVLTMSKLHNWAAFDVNDILAIEAEANLYSTGKEVAFCKEAATSGPRDPECPYCQFPLNACEPLWAESRKCCPDCEHPESAALAKDQNA